MNRIYADNAATRKMDREIIECYSKINKDFWGNASTLYEEGREARKKIEEAKTKIARCIHASKDEIFITSGGTESNNWTINGIANLIDNDKIMITTEVEHVSLLKPFHYIEKRNCKTDFMSVDHNCNIMLQDLKNNVANNNIGFISVMYANNETGTIFPINEIGEITRNNHILFHTDATQALGHIHIDVQKDQIDLLSASAHKFGAPKGIGFLYIKKGISLDSFILGGNQEFGKRAGTENVAAIVSMANALENSLKDLSQKEEKTREMRNFIESNILSQLDNVKVNAQNSNRLSGISNISFRNIDGIKLVQLLDSRGISVATGSACNKNQITTSHVLRAMGVDDYWARGTLRISINENLSMEEAKEICFHIVECINYLCS